MQMVLKKQSSEARSTLYTNTRSFAMRFARSAPKFKVRRVSHVNPSGPSSYDVNVQAIQGAVKGSVAMDRQLSRSDVPL
jgi:hypothetical protein